MRKRTVALVFVGLVLALVAGTLGVLSTPWAGERLCALAATRAEAAAGLPVAFDACRIRPLALELEARGVRVGPEAAPVFRADVLGARLALVQVLGGKVHLGLVRLVRPRLAIDARGPGGDAHVTCPPPVLSRVEVHQLEVSDGGVEVTAEGGVRVVVGGLEIHSRSSGVRRALDVATGRTRIEVSAGPVTVARGRHVHAVPRAALEAVVALDLSGADVSRAEVELDGVRFAGEGRVEDLCAPTLELAARAEGPLRGVLALAGATELSSDGAVQADVRVTGPWRRPDASGEVRLAGGRIAGIVVGDVTAAVRLAGETLRVERLEWPFPGGQVLVSGTLGLSRTVPVQAELHSTGVGLEEILERLGIAGAWVRMPMEAHARVAGTLWPPNVAGTLSADVRDFHALTRSYRDAAPGEAGVLEIPSARLESAVRVTRDALFLDGARASGGRGTLEADAKVSFSLAGGFSTRCRGSIDLDHLRRVAEIPWGGLAQVEATIGAAPYANPRIEGRARAEAFRFLDLDLGTLATDLAYGPDFTLRLTGVEGAKNATRYRGEGVVDLAATPAFVRSSRFEAKGRVRDLLDAVRDWLPRTRWMRDVVDGDVEFSGTATGPAIALDGTWEGRLGTGTLYGRRFESGRGEGTFLDGVDVKVERAELRRGTGALRFAGGWGALPPFPWNLEVSFAGVPLGDLDLPGGSWTGSASGTAALAGSFEHPQVRFAANGDAVALHGVALGTVQAAGTVTERRVVVTGGADGVKFAAEATLEGRLPFTARAELALDDVATLLPGTAPQGFRARVVGEAEAQGELDDLAAAQARARLSELRAGYSDFEVDATGPVDVLLSRGRVELQPVTLRGANTELTLSGARAASGELDVSASGLVDVRLLAGLVPAIRGPRGQLALEAHVGGTADVPVLVGAGMIEDVGFAVKGSGMTFAGIRGDLAFSQNRVLFDRLAGAVNGGALALRGEVELSSFKPVRHRVEAELDDVPFAVPAYLPATLAGRLEATGTPDATTVTGRLHVVRARYTANVDLEKSVLELRRRPPPPPRVYDRAGEWLRLDVQLAVDGDVRVDNDLVRGDVAGDLTVTGTLASPGLLGTLAMSEGSRILFRGNEFLLTHAVLDFTQRNAVDIALDVHGESQIRDYQIFMHVFGRLADPQLTLTSAPALTQPDIITLLSLGFTRRDAAADTGVQGVATAAAAQALFSASGLDEQVKRFLPRSDVVRDLSVRITSVYSESNQQIEPRAEFETWLLRDKLRLRYQAPLSGARGQKAQAELRLGAHTALQYQWDNDNPEVVTGDHGVDLKLRWEWTDDH